MIQILILVLFTTIQINAELMDPMNDAPLATNTTSYGAPCQRKEPSVKNSIFVFIFIAIFVVGVIGNFVAMAVIIFSNRLNSMPTNIFIVALAVCDVGAILFVIPIRIDTLFHSHNFCFNIHVCRMFTFTELLFHSASISQLFVIAIERFIAVNYPFVYQRVMSKTFTIMLILYTWCYALVWASLSQFNWERPSKHSVWFYQDSRTKLCLVKNRIYFNLSLVVVYIIPLAVMGGLYLSILRVALKQARIIESLTVHRDQQSSVKKQRREVRATKTLAIIYGAFTICWLPVTLISLTVTWVPQKYREFRIGFPVLSEVVFALFIEVLPTLNSSLNPFLYLFFSKKVRQEMVSYYQRFRHISPTVQIDSDTSIGQINNATRSKYMGDVSRHSTAFESNAATGNQPKTFGHDNEPNDNGVNNLSGQVSSMRL